MIGRMSAALWLAIAGLTGWPIVAQAAPTDGATLYEASASLRPGQFLWDDDATVADPLHIVVSIALQKMYVYRGGALVGVSAVSTGRPGHTTPTGDYEILQKARWHRSNLYSNAPMPFMQRLTWDGIAIHAGIDPGYPASHGCIRVPAAFARALFGMTRLGSAVTVALYPLEPPVYLRFDGLEWASADDVVTGGAPAPAVYWAQARSARLDYAAVVFAYE